MCRICYSSAPNDFDLSSSTAINVGIVGGRVCISYSVQHTLEWLENDNLLASLSREEGVGAYPARKIQPSPIT